MRRCAIPGRVLLLVILGLISIAQANAQPKSEPVYRNLVLEGGGIRGIAYGGALEALQERDILPHITRVGGTSAGAIQAALLAVGYTPTEIADITARTPVKQFNDGKFIFFGGFTRLFNKYGWYRGEKLSNWIGDLIAAKTGNADLTFAELHKQTRTGRYRDLYVVGTNLSQQREEVFSHETYPNMRVRDAVRISMSIPLYFRAVLLEPDGTIANNKKKARKADVLVDGGIIANFPIHLFDQARYILNADTAAKAKLFNEQTLGIRLDFPEQIEYDRQDRGLAPYPIHGFADYMGSFYNIVIENLNRQQLHPRDWERTISVSTAGFGPRIKRMSADDKLKLWNSGKEGAEYFFKKKDLK